MAAGGSTQRSLRKAYGALKDSTLVGLVKVNGNNKVLDIAIVKATSHEEISPKEKHVRTIIDAVSASRPRSEVAYCITALAKRLSKTHSWMVALKILIVVHRALRESDVTFTEELINNRSRGLMLNLSHFKDDSCPEAWDYSTWVRSYALYLEERLECFRILKYDLEKDHQENKECDTPELLEQLSALQQLLFRLVACKPNGEAVHNRLIHYPLSMVAAESVKIYAAINDGILNLVEKYFGMNHYDAIRALEIYRKAADQAERLSKLLEMCRNLHFGPGERQIKIEQQPSSVLAGMEDYVKESPRNLQFQSTANLDEPTQAASEWEEKNSLEFESVKSEHQSNSETCSDSVSWELELVADSKLVQAGELDILTLNNLYDDKISRQANQNGTYHNRQMGLNPFEVDEPMAAQAQQQIFSSLHEHQQQQQWQIPGTLDSTNPFGNPFLDTGFSSHHPI